VVNENQEDKENLENPVNLENQEKDVLEDIIKII
jgi:hypothetical protein